MKRAAWASIGLAFPLWYITFLTEFFGNFWYRITLSVAILVAYATLVDVDHMIYELKSVRVFHIAIGVVSAILLYVLFFIGFAIVRPMLGGEVEQVYAFRVEAEPELIATLLIFTSFGEEYFWRGFLQRRFSESYDRFSGVLIATIIYALVHMPTFNLSLVLAAFVAGLCWAVIYASTRSLWSVIISHIVWTELIFVLLPLT